MKPNSFLFKLKTAKKPHDCEMQLDNMLHLANLAGNHGDDFTLRRYYMKILSIKAAYS